ncbi:uracil-DNA glycosylase [Owenweeksia hongkongensis]|uniref:uracil-DNA glycosylase n=1 Tax=Owenweeksia hongkongensis TaxID=253245 RepID=UPI003A934BBC
MPSKQPEIHASWYDQLSNQFNSDYFTELKSFLISEKAEQTVYPPGSKIFSAFNHTPFTSVKVVILGQDPYHGPGQANGLSFSVSPGIKIPPSLKNIYKEIEQDLKLPLPNTGDLSKWADQGVLLLNAVLTVRHKQPGSHQKRGWETFTDAVIKKLSDEKNGVVFLLWGNFARSKKALIDSGKHHILEAPHPSPFSAHTGFFGCGHFSKANEILEKQGQKPIDWKVD